MKASKYKVGYDAGSRTYNGIKFDSKMEMRYYMEEIVPKLETGEYTVCEMQKRYILQEKFVHKGRMVRAIEYKADFYIMDKDGHERVIDVKGFATPVALLKRKLFWYKYPELDYVWLKYKNKKQGWVEC